MTLKQCTDHIYGTAVAGYFNGEKFSREELYSYLKNMFRPEASNTDRTYMTIAMPDGWWYFTVNQYAPGEFDWYIPDDRKAEARLKAELMERAGI